GGRIDESDGVAAPLTTRTDVGHPAPEVDHRSTIDVHRYGCAHVAELREVGGERLSHRREGRITFPLHLCAIASRSGPHPRPPPEAGAPAPARAVSVCRR